MDNKEIPKKVKELFEQDFTRQEIADKLGLSLSSTKRILGDLHLRYTPEQRSRIMSRRVKQCYENGKLKPLKGELNPAKRPEVREKCREYQLKHSEEMQAKREATCLEKYGAKNVFELKRVQDKIKQTNLKKYGYTSPMKSPEVRARTSKTLKKTLAEKYKHDEQVKKIIAKYQELGRKLKPSEMIEVLELAQSNAYILMHRYELEKYIELETNEFEGEIGDFLKANEIKFEYHNREVIHPKEIDLYIPDYKVGIEANDMGTHNSTVSTYGAKPKDRMYHYYKSRGCEDKGVRLIHVWDYEWYNNRTRPILESIILGACGKVTTLYARKCKVETKTPVELREFFNGNHIAGYKGGKEAICLTYNGEVVMAYVFGTPYFGRGKYEWEVIRATTKLGYRVVGGASRIWKYFVKQHNPQSCVFYVDYNYFDGHSLQRLGFNYESCNPTPKNFIVSEGRVIGRSPKRHKELEELVKQKKVWRFYTSGSKTYIWRKDG